MYFSKERISPLRQVFLYAGYCLFLGLFSLLAIKLLYQGVHRNPYEIFLVFLVAVNVLVAVLFVSPRLSAFAARLRLGVLSVTGAAALFFVSAMPLPITTVTVNVVQVPWSMQYFLQHHDRDSRAQWRSVYKMRGDSHTAVSFVLPQPIQGRDEDLRLYMGYNPHRIHFGRYPPPSEVYKVSFGTDILGVSLPLTIYDGKGLDLDSGVISGRHVSFLANHHIRAPILQIMWDENRVRRDSSPVRILVVKILWLIFYIGISVLMLWSHRWTPKMKRLRAEIEKYLTH